MNFATTPLGELIEDLRPDPAGALRQQVDHVLGAAYDLLLDHRDGTAGPETLSRAAQHVDAAIAALTHYRGRLERLDE